MADTPASPEHEPRRAAGRLRGAGWALAGVALLLAAFAAVGRISPAEAALGFAVVTLLAAVAPRPRSVLSPRRMTGGDNVVSPQTLALLSGLPDPTLVLDRRGLVLAFNARARATLPALRTGDPLSFALRAPEVLDAVRAALGGRAPTITSYAERVPIERWFEVSVTPIVFDKVGAGAAVVTLRDLTEQRRSERMRVDFIANASHELRTPLASLLGFIETLQGPARNDVEARARFLEIMRTQAARMSRLIDDLLSLSRIELKAHVRPDSAVEISGIVRSVIDAIGPLAQDRNVELVFTPPETPVWALGDRDELIRVVENLIENAVKYGASGGRVETSVTAGEGPQGVRVMVRDFGPGIAPEHLPRLTERFYRGDAQASRDAGGTGLGLALVKHILQRHGGQLAIESRLGEGATFVVTLDPAPATPALSAPASLKVAG